jgi:hypothetical protein
MFNRDNIAYSTITLAYQVFLLISKILPRATVFRNGKQENEGMRIYFFFFLGAFFLADFRTTGAGDFFCTTF